MFESFWALKTLGLRSIFRRRFFQFPFTHKTIYLKSLEKLQHFSKIIFLNILVSNSISHNTLLGWSISLITLTRVWEVEYAFSSDIRLFRKTRFQMFHTYPEAQVSYPMPRSRPNDLHIRLNHIRNPTPHITRNRWAVSGWLKVRNRVTNEAIAPSRVKKRFIPIEWPEATHVYHANVWSVKIISV